MKKVWANLMKIKQEKEAKALEDEENKKLEK
jgi:hypothetical protein